MVGPPSNGGGNNDMAFVATQTQNNNGGPVKMRDAAATPTSTANDQAILCFPADNALAGNNVFGGTMTWFQSSHPADSVTVSAYMGNGSAQFPVVAMTYTFSATSIANAAGAQGTPTAGTIPVFFTPNQLQNCQAKLPTCFQ